MTNGWERNWPRSSADANGLARIGRQKIGGTLIPAHLRLPDECRLTPLSVPSVLAKELLILAPRIWRVVPSDGARSAGTQRGLAVYVRWVNGGPLTHPTRLDHAGDGLLGMARAAIAAAEKVGDALGGIVWGGGSFGPSLGETRQLLTSFSETRTSGGAREAGRTRAEAGAVGRGALGGVGRRLVQLSERVGYSSWAVEPRMPHAEARSTRRRSVCRRSRLRWLLGTLVSRRFRENGVRPLISSPLPHPPRAPRMAPPRPSTDCFARGTILRPSRLLRDGNLFGLAAIL
jgi:hypothetical protein